MTKLELEQINTRLAADNAALRAEVSALTAQLAAKPVAPADDVSEFDTPAEAMARCRELTIADTERRHSFVVRGTRVICKLRTTH